MFLRARIAASLSFFQLQLRYVLFRFIARFCATAPSLFLCCCTFIIFRIAGNGFSLQAMDTSHVRVLLAARLCALTLFFQVSLVALLLRGDGFDHYRFSYS
jgi:hypothetical protein